MYNLFNEIYNQIFLSNPEEKGHLYIIGKTGMGKTTLLENMIYCDIQRNQGVGVIDPHGDLSNRILNFIPRYRVNDVCYFNPQDQDWPFSFNLLKGIDKKNRAIFSSGLIAIFKKIWPEFWGPRTEHIFRNTILGLLEMSNPCFLSIPKILSEYKSNFRKRWISKIKDPLVKYFWQKEFENYSERFQKEAIAPLQNKLGQFLSNPLIRNIINQDKNKLDLKDIMDNQKILIVNLSKGAIGEDVSSLLGAVIVSLFQLQAMERINQSEDKRKSFVLYIDEFQNFATKSFSEILSEARKFKLFLVLSHQYIGQLDEELKKAVFGNIRNLIVFQISGEDNEILKKEIDFPIDYDPISIDPLRSYDTNLKATEQYKMIVKLSGREGKKPYCIPCPLPLSLKTNRNQKEKIIKLSREHYCQEREKVEERIKRFFKD